MRGIFNIISLCNASAPGDIFKVQCMATLDAYVAVAKQVSIISFVWSILLGGYVWSIVCKVLLIDWWTCSHMA